MADLEAAIERVEVSAYKIPTDFPESDGTFEWNATTLVLVELRAGGATGLGFSYTSASAAELIRELLAPVVIGGDVLDIAKHWAAMNQAVRNVGRSGIASAAIAAMDIAIWDLHAHLFRLPLVKLFGQMRERIPTYASGGFTSYPREKLYDQLQGWRENGFKMAKIKIGRHPERDVERVRTAREAIGETVQLFVDANGAYSCKQALAKAEELADSNVTWFEEPVSSDDLAGLRLLRDRAPAEIEIAAGEYGYDAIYFRRMLEAGAVDVLQVDATRCGGFTGFLQASALCDAFQIPLSAHTAPTIHQHVCCAVSGAKHVEYFHDHARIEQMLFDGSAKAVNGFLQPDLSRRGLGIEFKRPDAEEFLIR